jgi:hypothetical protein
MISRIIRVTSIDCKNMICRIIKNNNLPHGYLAVLHRHWQHNPYPSHYHQMAIQFLH